MFDELIDGKNNYSQAPRMIPRFSKRDKGKTQVLLSLWNSTNNEIAENIKVANKACFKLWNSTDDILYNFGMALMDELDKYVWSWLRISKLDQIQDESKENIKEPSEINKEDLNKFFTVPVKLATLSNDYVQKVLKYMKRDIYRTI